MICRNEQSMYAVFFPTQKMGKEKKACSVFVCLLGKSIKVIVTFYVKKKKSYWNEIRTKQVTLNKFIYLKFLKFNLLKVAF